MTAVGDSKGQSASVPFTPVFVGGAPRSGTTVLYALLCTADRSNPYTSECSYFSEFVKPYLVGLRAFDVHTRYYFDSPEAFAQHHAQVLLRELTGIWERLGRPELLVLKDPLLTPYFHYLAALLPSAQFVVSVRDPRDTIASRIEVARRQNRGAIISYRPVSLFCDEYIKTYRAILDNEAVFGDRLQFVNYADVVNGNLEELLRKLGASRIYPDRLWSKAMVDTRNYFTDSWSTALYGQKLSGESVNRYVHTLSPAMEAFILRRCGSLAQEIGLAITSSRPLPGNIVQWCDASLRMACKVAVYGYRKMRVVA